MAMRRGALAVPRLLAALALAALVPGCTTAPLAPIPEPLPESLEWRVPDAGGAFLGVRGEENDSGSLEDLFFMPGVRVKQVVENSPAAAAGLQPGDIVLSFAGKDVNDPAALDALVAAQAPGARVDLGVRRGDTVLKLPLTLAGAGNRQQAPEVLFRLDPARSRAGWATEPGGGARLVSAPEDSPVREAGLELGSVVRAVDDRPVLSDRALIRELTALEPGTRVRLTVEPPGGAARDVEVTLQEQPTRVTGLQIPLVYGYEASADGKRTHWDLLDWWVFSLFEYDRADSERTYTLFTLFGWKVFKFQTGVGELGS
jgi:membrane-associated protease RseP (regulator of RpoE activity)